MSGEVGGTTSTNRMKIPERGTGVLRGGGDDSARPWPDVPERDRSKFLRERYWIKQWGYKRWPSSDFIRASSHAELNLGALGRRPNDPGDVFLWLFLTSSKSIVNVRTWVEVTEVFLPGLAEKVDIFVRQYNGLRGKGEIDAEEFLRSLDLGTPGARLQHDMADYVISAVVKKLGRDIRAALIILLFKITDVVS